MNKKSTTGLLNLMKVLYIPTYLENNREKYLAL